MTPSEQAELLRQRMHEVRNDLDDDVSGIVKNAKTLADWKHYVKSFPWASMAATAALGFALVPKKLQVIRPDAETLEKLAKKNLLVVTTEPKAQAKAEQQQKGLLSTLAAFAGTLALKGAASYLTGRVAQAARQQGQHPDVATPPDHDAGADFPYGVPR